MHVFFTGKNFFSNIGVYIIFQLVKQKKTVSSYKKSPFTKGLILIKIYRFKFRGLSAHASLTYL